MFQTVFSVQHQELKTVRYIQRQVFVRPLLLPAASLVRLAASSRLYKAYLFTNT